MSYLYHPADRDERDADWLAARIREQAAQQPEPQPAPAVSGIAFADVLDRARRERLDKASPFIVDESFDLLAIVQESGLYLVTPAAERRLKRLAAWRDHVMDGADPPEPEGEAGSG